MIIEQFDFINNPNGGINPLLQQQYSRNRMSGIHEGQAKTSFSQKTQDLLHSVQKNSQLINNIKYGGSSNAAAQSNLIGKASVIQPGSKRMLPTNNNIQFRKSFGGAQPNRQEILGAAMGLVNNVVTQKSRPTTAGKHKQGSQDNGKFSQMHPAKNDRSRQSNGLVAALPSSQQQKSMNNAAIVQGGNSVAANHYYVNKSINSFKN